MNKFECALLLSIIFAVSITSSARADLSGFAAFSPLNTMGPAKSVAVSADNSSVTLSDGGAQVGSSLFSSAPQPITSWTATFTYQASNYGGNGDGGADGAAFVIQDDPRGAKAIGDSGNGLGYAGANGIKNSVCYSIGIFSGSHYGIGLNGTLGDDEDTDVVDYRSKDPVRVTLQYDGAVLAATLKDLTTGATTTTEDEVDISAAVGGKGALVGFSGASGATTATQVISNFNFTVNPDVPLAQRKHVAPKAGKSYNTRVDYVDPLIGTANGGNTFPGPEVPFGMVQFSPDNHTKSFGYVFPGKWIDGFSLTHMSGVGCTDFGDVFLTATTGDVATKPEDYGSLFSHKKETASVGYYQVNLLKYGINVELTATTRTGVARFTFPPHQPANILVPISHVLTTASHAKIQIVGNNEIDGQVTSQAFCGNGSQITVFFAMQVDRSFAKFGTWSGDSLSPSSSTAEQADRDAPGIGAYVSYPQGVSAPVTARIGISFVDMDGARANLKAEAAGKSFDQIRSAAVQAWTNELGLISVDRGGDTAERVKFYTALYHSLLMPNVFSDSDGRYMGFDNQIHTVATGHAEYANYSGWDIYRTQIPLLGLIEPKRLQDMCQSVVDMYKYGGWIDRWPQANRYTNVMCGSPLTIAVATAWDDGLHNFDIATGYEGMYKDAMQAPPDGMPYRGEGSIDWMNKLGYIPDDKEGYGSVSQTEEDCLAYASLSDLAASLGKTNDADVLKARAMNYRNNFDPDTKFMRPKLANGDWKSPFSPTQGNGYVEGNAWEYRWLVPFDEAGLIQLMGGDDAFNTELDKFFGYTAEPITGNGFYDATNEPDLEAPFLYNYSGQPWKTQERVRYVLGSAYKTTPSGIAGNDDCGTMSAWFVLAALGIYPVDPATSTFELDSPIFAKATIHAQNPAGKTVDFVVTAPNASSANQYVQAVSMNNRKVEQCWIAESAIVKGGTLQFDLGAVPSKTWGTAVSQRPPSFSVH